MGWTPSATATPPTATSTSTSCSLRASASDGWRTASGAIEEIFRAVVALGGTITGEHGVGVTQRAYLRLRHSAETLAAMRAIKSVFDPNGIMNPDKIFRPAMIRLSRTIHFNAGRSLWRRDWTPEKNRAVYGDEGPRGYGHNYKLEVAVVGKVDPETAMVVNLTDLDRILNLLCAVTICRKVRNSRCSLKLHAESAPAGKPLTGSTLSQIHSGGICWKICSVRFRRSSSLSASHWMLFCSSTGRYVSSTAERICVNGLYCSKDVNRMGPRNPPVCAYQRANSAAVIVLPLPA